MVENQAGTINVFGGSIAHLTGFAYRYRVLGTSIGALEIGYSNFDPERAIFQGCYIGTLGNAPQSQDSAVTFQGCVIAECGSLPKVCVLRDTTISSSTAATDTWQSEGDL